jgi:tetratricopeptide (TPR) repeat protein
VQDAELALSSGERRPRLVRHVDAEAGTRLQSAAPVNGVLVGETTYRATAQLVDYREADPVDAKGKAEPVPVWEALQARSRLGVDVPHEARTALVGRQRELAVLRDALDRAREELQPQLVTLVGVPGMGKSRLVYELSQIVDAAPELVSWRQGRSLPYGDGVSLWAIAEMIKAQAGILETDDEVDARAKLVETVEELVPEAREQEWVLRHVGALAGLAADEGTAPREEAFAAWRRFFEALAEQRALVLVFEDLHWADDGLLDFVDHLVDWAGGVPILVVATARPELLERRSGWGGGKPNAITLSLSPLSDDDSARLIGSLLQRPLLVAEEQAELLARTGGNPLYAEQYVRKLAARGGEEDLPVPESIQGIVAARLDALPPPEKALLQDAAVIGKVFWAGAVAALGGRTEQPLLDQQVHALERKQFLRRERRTSVAEETQYAFLHVLVRDVAYGQIPRAARIDKHRRAAEWIESLGRPEDHAEMLAHHYLSALELARAERQDTSDLAPQARAALRDAGDRARALAAFRAAIRFYREAIELWPEEAASERADLLFRLGLAFFGTGEAGAGEALEQARSALLAVGDPNRAAEADSLLAEVWWLKGESERCVEHLERALELVRDESPSPEKARVLSQVARYQMLAGELDVELAREALELAEALELDEIRAHLLITIGTARSLSGDLGGGRHDLERGLEVALAGNWLEAAVRGYTNLAMIADQPGGQLHEALRINLEAERVTERLGSVAQRRWARGNMIWIRQEAGEWDDCLRDAEEFLAESEELGPHYHDPQVFAARSTIRIARGETEAALADQTEALARARRARDPQVVGPVLGFSAWVLVQADRLREARALAEELLSGGGNLADLAIDPFIWAAESLGLGDRMMATLTDAASGPWLDVARAVLTGDFERAADIFDAIGAAPHAALARLRAAGKLIDAGRRAEADVQLRQALVFWRSVGATRYVREGEALLAASA